MLARCTSSLDLHMLIIPFWYLFRTLLVPKVALGMVRCLRRYAERTEELEGRTPDFSLV